MTWYRIVIALLCQLFLYFFLLCLASCYNCNKSGHIARDCPESGSKSCYNCGKSGHISRECDAPDNRGSGGGGGGRGGGGGGYGGQSRDVRTVGLAFIVLFILILFFINFSATAVASLATFLVIALMVAAAVAGVVVEDMEVETVNATDAEMSVTFLGIALIPNVEVEEVAVTMTRLTTDKHKKRIISHLVSRCHVICWLVVFSSLCVVSNFVSRT